VPGCRPGARQVQLITRFPNDNSTNGSRTRQSPYRSTLFITQRVDNLAHLTSFLKSLHCCCYLRFDNLHHVQLSGFDQHSSILFLILTDVSQVNMVSLQAMEAILELLPQELVPLQEREVRSCQTEANLALLTVLQAPREWLIQVLEMLLGRPRPTRLSHLGPLAFLLTFSLHRTCRISISVHQ
jgi:hypothetical protein